MQTVARQFELSLWRNLKAATSDPEAADLQQLLQDLEQVLGEVQEDQRLRVAGEAIAQIVEVYALRANLILDALEVRDTSVGPILSEGFLSGLMRQSMTIDLSDLMEDLFSEDRDPQEQETAGGSQVAILDKKKAKAMADKARKDAKRMVAELAGKEHVSEWASAIARWLTARSSTEPVPLLQLQQDLGMPLVEVWLGLLHNQESYQLKQCGDFYDPYSIEVSALK